MQIILSATTVKTIAAGTHGIVAGVLAELGEDGPAPFTDALFDKKLAAARMELDGCANLALHVEGDAVVLEVDDKVLLAVLGLYQKTFQIINPMIKGFVSLGKLLREELQAIEDLVKLKK